jgi:hypothetical protein
MVESLIKTPTLTRELNFELAGVGYFIDEELLQRYTRIPFRQELEEFLEASTRMRLFNFAALYNDIEGFLQAGKPPGEAAEFRKKFRMKFPYLAALDPIVVFFIPANKQAAALSSLFLTEVISKIIQVYGQSKSLITCFREAERHFQICKAPPGYHHDEHDQARIQNMPFELFDTLTPALGKKPLLSLYHLSLDKLESQYSNLTSSDLLRNSIGQLIKEHE